MLGVMKDRGPLFNGLGRTLASRVIVICVSDIKKGDHFHICGKDH